MNKNTVLTRRFRAKLYEKGLCIDNCGNRAKKGHLRCQDCLDVQAEKAKERRVSKKMAQMSSLNKK
ncbi:MAG: hypothetical protein ACOCRX_00850 [Candidatus Woesearchaeota archaeon]